MGVSHVTVSNATHLRMTFYNDVPIDQRPTVDHSFDIVRGYPRAVSVSADDAFWGVADEMEERVVGY